MPIENIDLMFNRRNKIWTRFEFIHNYTLSFYFFFGYEDCSTIWFYNLGITTKFIILYLAIDLWVFIFESLLSLFLNLSNF